MSPHTEDLHRVFRFEDLVDEPLLNVNPSRVGTREVTHELFEWRWFLERVCFENVEECFGFRAKSRGSEFLSVLLCLLCENDGPVHQPGSSSQLGRGVSMPSRIDSLIPGIERR